MSKPHQSNRSEYQIRIDGKPISYPDMICKEAMEEFAETCKKHPDCYVDIVRVSTEIIINQGFYQVMERNFSPQHN